jgi:hypothetical protein
MHSLSHQQTSSVPIIPDQISRDTGLQGHPLATEGGYGRAGQRKIPMPLQHRPEWVREPAGPHLEGDVTAATVINGYLG